VTKKKAEGEMNTAKDEAAQKVAQREQASPLSPVDGQSSGRFGLDHGLKDSSNGFNVDLGLRQIPSQQRSVRSWHGIGVR